MQSNIPYYKTVSYEIEFIYSDTVFSLTVEIDAEDDADAKFMFNKIAGNMFSKVNALSFMVLKKGAFDKRYRGGKWRKWTVLRQLQAFPIDRVEKL